MRLIALSIVVTAGFATAAAEPTPVPGTVGLVAETRPLPHACTPSTRVIKVARAGDPAPLVAALTAKTMPGLDYDAADPARLEAHRRQFDRWFKRTNARFTQAAAVETAGATDASAPPAARVAALMRLVALRSQLATVLQTATIPTNVRPYPEAVRAYCDGLVEAVAPVTASADEARRTCAALVAQANLGAGPWDTACAVAPARP
ncbi:MAG: hypothetical protein R3B06_25425 [Kofleriaceae bacterium]